MIKPNAQQLNPRTGKPKPKLCSFAIAATFTLLLAGCVKKVDSPKQSRLEGVIVGDSMAPHYLGKHRVSNCESCKIEIAFRHQADFNRGVTCPNCGSQTNLADETKIREAPADLVQIDGEASIDRWSVVAFKRDADATAGIKRVVGLPGETIWFEAGNVFCRKAGEVRLLKKSLDDQVATRVLVHDNAFETKTNRWTVVTSKEALSAVSDVGGVSLESQKTVWRKFQPRRCYEHLQQNDWEPAIEDNYGSNQGMARQLNPVNEVMVECELLAERSEVVLMIAGESESVRVRFVRAESGVAVERFSASVDRGQAEPSREEVEVGAGQKVICQLSNIDHQLLVGVNGKVLSVVSSDAAVGVDGPTNIFVATPAEGKLADYRIRIWRDLFYFSPIPKEQLIQRQERQAKTVSGYFLVGDNLPVSSDSRHWNEPLVSREQLLGRVFQN